MSKTDILQCLKELDGKDGVSLILCGAKSAYMKHASSFVEKNAHMYYAQLQFTEDLECCVKEDCIVKIAIFVEGQKAESTYHRLPELGKNLTAVLSGDSWIDISNKTVSKGAALKAIQMRLNIRKTQCMAFGDYLNDYNLLLCCTESYEMENAHPELKKIAKYITASNDEQGVMKVLRTL